MRFAKVVIGALAVVLVAAWGGRAVAQSPPAAGAIHLSQAWARRAPMMMGQGGAGSGHGRTGGAGNGAVYVLIENRGSDADTLLSATSDAAGAESSTKPGRRAA